MRDPFFDGIKLEQDFFFDKLRMEFRVVTKFARCFKDMLGGLLEECEDVFMQVRENAMVLWVCFW